MRLGEGGHPSRIAERLGQRAIAPIDCQSEGVQRARIVDLSGQHTDTILIHRRGRHARQTGSHVGHGHRRAQRVTAAIVVGDRHANGIAVHRVVVQVLVRLGKGCRPCGIADHLDGRSVTPIHLQRERVQAAWIGDHPAQRTHTVFLHGRG